MMYLVALTAVLAGTFVTVSGHASGHVYAIVVGNNAPPSDVSNAMLKPLRFADDDAARVYEWSMTFADEAYLLTVLDATTQERFPHLAGVAVAPTLDGLRRTVQQIKSRLTLDKTKEEASTVIFYFSGHGSLPHAGLPASLALLDGPLAQEVLYEDVLAELPATHVHVLVDACHAEAVVRPRDASAMAPQAVEVDPEQAARWIANHTLARFPQVGALIASAADQQSHEWDVYEGGIFTHEMLSGLRGAADVNQDQLIEYSEIHAFLSAANRDISDKRMRLDIVAHPPPLNLREPLVDAHNYRDVAWVTGAMGRLRRFFVEDSRGVRLLDAHMEDSSRAILAVPAYQTLYVKTSANETAIYLNRGQTMSVDSMSFGATSVESRDATASALQRGLFATPFGLAYYRGFVDNAGDLPVEMWEPPLPVSTNWMRELLHKGPWIAAGIAVAGAGVSGVFMIKSYHDYSDTNYQRQSVQASQHYDAARTGLFISVGATAVFSALGIWSLEVDDSPTTVP